MTLKDITGETPMSALLKETTPTTAQVVTSSMQAEPPAVDDADLISPDDFNARRTQYYRQVRQAVEEAFPIKNERYTLHVRDVRWDKEDTPSIEEQRKATLEGHNLTRKLSGKYELIDNATGQPVQTTNRRTLLNMPVLSQDGTYIINGNAYTLPMQMRLMPAVYVRVTADGYPEAQFNIRPRTGQSFRIQMEPKTSVFYITSGGRKIPFYPVMKAMGVDDKALEISWGPEILRANQAQKVNPHALQWIQEAARRGLPKEIPK